MKDLKFRAWLKNEKKIYYVETLDFDTKEAYLCLAGLYEFNEIELMQYTGLKDKNGVEIYEGDIVEWCGNKMEIFWGTDIGFGYGFCWRNVKGNSYYHESMTGFIDEYEVIGNIYENPELLKKEI